MSYNTENLEPGDVIIDTLTKKNVDPSHALMWTGNGDKPLAHATDGESKKVIQSRIKYLSKEPHPIVEQFHVFRHSDKQIAAQAAKFASLWAQNNKDDESPLHLKYSVPRRSQANAVQSALQEVEETWDVMSLFHAVRAFARLKSDKPITSIGVDCSQFIAYSYQCASIEKFVGDTKVDSNYLKNLMCNDSAISLKTDINVVDAKRTAIKLHAERKEESTKIRQFLPGNAATLMNDNFFQRLGKKDGELRVQIAKGLQFDAKYTTITYLYDQLIKGDSGFIRVGYAIPKPVDSPTKLRILPQAEFNLMKQNIGRERNHLTIGTVINEIKGFE